MAIYATLRRDHKEIKDMLLKLVKNPYDQETFENLKTELTLHNRTEEQAFYHILADKLGMMAFVSECAEEEHKIVDEMVAGFEEIKEQDDRKTLAKMMKKTIEAHINKEEGEIFALAKGQFSVTEVNEINMKFKKIKDSLRASIGVEDR